MIHNTQHTTQSRERQREAARHTKRGQRCPPVWHPRGRACRRRGWVQSTIEKPQAAAAVAAAALAAVAAGVVVVGQVGFGLVGFGSVWLQASRRQGRASSVKHQASGVRRRASSVKGHSSKFLPILWNRKAVRYSQLWLASSIYFPRPYVAILGVHSGTEVKKITMLLFRSLFFSMSLHLSFFSLLICICLCLHICSPPIFFFAPPPS